VKITIGENRMYGLSTKIKRFEGSHANRVPGLDPNPLFLPTDLKLFSSIQKLTSRAKT